MTTAAGPSRPGRPWCTRLGVALITLAMHATVAAGGASVDGEILVRLRSGAELTPLLVQHGLTLVARFGDRPIYRLKVVGVAKVEDKIKALEAEPDVIDAEPNLVYEIPDAKKNAVWAIGTVSEYAEQWAAQAMRLADAQRFSTGEGVRVAVLDTGVDLQHPALAGKLLPGFDFVDFDADPSEVGTPADRGFGHGTHVAGLVALVAPGARIMPLRVLNPEGRGNAWALAEAMLYAVDPDGDPSTDDGAHIINLSLGTVERTEIFKTVAKLVTCWKPPPGAAESDAGNIGDKLRCDGFGGAVVIAAAGNDASDKIREYPAAETGRGLLSVGASEADGWLAEFSNFGGWVKAAAPGDAVTSSVPGGGFATWSGTSMAAALAAGAASLVRATNPRLSADEVTHRLTHRGRNLCGTNLRQIDPLAAMTNRSTNYHVHCAKARSP